MGPAWGQKGWGVRRARPLERFLLELMGAMASASQAKTEKRERHGGKTKNSRVQQAPKNNQRATDEKRCKPKSARVLQSHHHDPRSGTQTSAT